MTRKFETKYGYFTGDGNEYVIKTYKTPKPWVNVISNGRYGLVVSQAGGGFSWLDHSEFNRVNRWHQDLVQDNWGKYIYVKNNVTGEVWSPTFMPVKKQIDNFECRHGLGYTIFNSDYKGITIELTIFVPVNETMEIWDLKVKNDSGSKVDLSFFTYFEWCLGSSADHHREFHKTFLETEFDENLNAMIAGKRLWEIPLGDRGHWNINYTYKGFLSSNKKVNEYEGDKEAFIGQYGDLINPAGVCSDHLSQQTGCWTDPIGCLRINSKISNQGEDRIIFYLGLKESKEEINNSLKKFSSPESVENALNEVKSFWLEKLDPLTIETPDEGMDLLVNKWLKYQAISGRLWGRTAYYQQSGAFGFRDQLQDSLVFLPIDPEFTKRQIKLHAKHQFVDGTVLHWWHPITETGLETKMTDDLLWLPFLVIQYIQETDDFKIFNEEIEYYNVPSLKESLYRHCIKAIDKVLSRMSERGIPLIGAGDWNDGINAAGLEMKGESFWLAEFLYYILEYFSNLAMNLGDRKISDKYKGKAVLLKENFNKASWDGKWYLRATKDNGDLIGSSVCEEGKIYLNAQTWSVISGIGEQGKNIEAMNSVETILNKKNGPLLLFPAYSKPDKFIGYLSRYAAGRRENGGVYTHAATWSIWAFAELKKEEIPYNIFKRLAPVYNGMNADEYSCESYVTPGNIDGPASPHYGRGGWTWYTGSAAWFQKVIVDRILGVRADEKGLLIDPCIPKEWEHYSVKRKFRNKIYLIEVNNPEHVYSGVKTITVDGSEISGNIVLCNDDKDLINVKVYLGK